MNSDLADIDKKFDVEYEEMEELMAGVREGSETGGSPYERRKCHTLHLWLDGNDVS